MTARPSSRQLVLDLPHAARLGRDDFLSAPSNEMALAMVEHPAEWPGPALALVGPAGSGKSHLLEIFAAATGAHRLDMAALDIAHAPLAAEAGAIALDDGEGGSLDERALFHLLNLVKERGGRLLIATRRSPAYWPVTLPDLASRLRALPNVAIEAPDEALVRAVLVKLFLDRQLAVEPGVIETVVARLERSLVACRRFVELADRMALAERRGITRPLVTSVLGAMEVDADDPS